MYKIMVVDDEEEIRKGIIKKMDWSALGYDVVGEAENGQEVLEKAEVLQPDVIMTDIRIPFMDGLELGQKLAKIMPLTKIIVFSGYDDFEYAKKAIKINVVEYLLKPINSQELTEVLKKLKNKLDKEYEEKSNVEILKKYYQDSIPVIREQFLVGLIEDRVDADQWKAQRESLEINLNKQYLCTAVIKVDKTSSLDTADKSLLLISSQKAIDDNMERFCSFISFIYLDKVVVICNTEHERDINNIICGINDICKQYRKITGISISAGIGNVYSQYYMLNQSYKEASSALEFSLIMGNGQAIYINDVEPDRSKKFIFNNSKEEKIIDDIKLSSDEEITENIIKEFSVIKETMLPISEYKVYFIEMILSLIKLMQMYEINSEAILGKNFDMLRFTEKLDSIDEIEKWFIDISLKISSSIKNKRFKSSSLIVEKAQKYIEANFMKPDLSVDMMCDNIHISPTYFSTIFKKETGLSFVSYLTNIRLEQAINLLNTTADKTYMIAEKVGYDEANYFSYVFKKKYGVSPTNYRKNRL